MIATVPVPPVDGRLYAASIWEGENPRGSPFCFEGYASDVVPFCCEEYPIGAAPACGERIRKSGCAVTSLTVVAFAVNAIAGKLIARTSVAKTKKAVASFLYDLDIELCSY